MNQNGSIDAETLVRLQSALAKLLTEFDRVCQELQIPYTLSGGTIIGAVRHRDFIPWDDDADVLLLRGDYEKFLKEAPHIIGREFAIENSRTNRDYPNMFSNLVIKGTYFIPAFIARSPYRMAIGLDIFPFDRTAPTRSRYIIQKAETWFWGRMMYLQGTPTPYLEIKSPLKYGIYAITSFMYWSMRLLHIKPHTLQRKWEHAARRYEHSSSLLFTDFTNRNPDKWLLKQDDVVNALSVRFGELLLRIPNDYDRILTRAYGNYMELPPVSQRKSHQPVLIDFGDFGESNPKTSFPKK
ncbi:MAG: LicD family protein [Ancrocorticia sp.]|jgi:lipopolysaccharide cholinephosphotransferase|nr:LicD family protein [Ancrocorticia sp.]